MLLSQGPDVVPAVFREKVMCAVVLNVLHPLRGIFNLFFTAVVI